MGLKAMMRRTILQVMKTLKMISLEVSLGARMGKLED
jgi:hypothetical protein